MGELAYADLNSNFKFQGCLRPIWSQKSHISSFSLKYPIAIAFVHIRQLTGHFVIDLNFYMSATGLNRGFRLVRLYCGRIDGYGPRKLPYSGQWPQLYHYLEIVSFVKIFHLNQSVYFIRSPSFFNSTNSENCQNSRFIVVLNVSIASL